MAAARQDDSEEDRARAGREATDWLILLQDDPDDPGRRADFEAWLAAGQANAAAWAETQRISALIAATPPAHSRHWGAGFSAAQPSARSRHRPARWMAAALAAACLAIVAAPGALLRLQADHLTGTAELRDVRLEDGSRVDLGPGSAIAVAYESGERRVRLLRGRAYFEVRRDPARPFRVEAGGLRTTVLGTGFEMGLEEDGASVAVRHGLVQVDYPDGEPPLSERLGGGQRIDIRWSGDARRQQVRADRIAAWTDRKLIASDRPVGEVIDELRPWYGGVLLATGPGLREARVTGVYDLADPVAAVEALGQAHAARVQRISPWLVIISFN
ncbi:FecR domain-containing protein [Sandaracinobacter sp. RS1-74]|uniref:FecR family protein n=1 Tax=Sandaracinobacteroides sayramensis TaxID=2913411 RepID=UPI001EDB3F53|nr:FecR domain-containing protein [Sandaracinobacteroides sayramensis]MCG2842087.1 FecR domain-containing protein [Sandaracinobacteroides sayramensis]